MSAEQEAVYAAEHATVDQVTRRFATMAQAQEYVAELTTSERWELAFPQAEQHVQVEARSSSAHYSHAYGTGIIVLANNPRARTLSTVLHELAHLVVPTNTHGPAFRNAMLTLVRMEMGFPAYLDLSHEYARRLAAVAA